MSDEYNEGKFELKKKTSFEDLASNTVTELVESDLCFQDQQNIYQFKFIKPENEEKFYDIKPGTFVFSQTNSGIVLSKLEFKARALLESATATAAIIKEAKLFFSRLDVYKKLGRPEKRAVLLFSKPGMGKTSAIESVCNDLIKEDPGTVVVVWPTSEIEADAVSKFLNVYSRYTEEATRLVLIMEDIGGSEREGSHQRNPVDSGLLNLLDGIGVAFKKPTFIMATTNHPENLLESLADRPGRFDLMLRLQPPTHKEKIELMKFIVKRVLSADEENALGLPGTEEFSIAHLEEVAVRAELHDKSHAEVIKELVDHKKLFKNDFEDKSQRRSMGINDLD